MGHGGHVPPLLQMSGHGGGTVSRRTANKKLTKLHWPSWKRSPKRLIVLFRAKKVEGHDQQKYLGALHFCTGPVPPTFKFVPAPLQMDKHQGRQSHIYETAGNLEPRRMTPFLLRPNKSTQLALLLKIIAALAKLTVSSSSSDVNSDILIN